MRFLCTSNIRRADHLIIDILVYVNALYPTTPHHKMKLDEFCFDILSLEVHQLQFCNGNYGSTVE